MFAAQSPRDLIIDRDIVVALLLFGAEDGFNGNGNADALADFRGSVWANGCDVTSADFGFPLGRNFGSVVAGVVYSNLTGDVVDCWHQFGSSMADMENFVQSVG